MGFIVKNTTILNPIDLIAPHTCRGCGIIGSPLCHCCKNNIILEHQNICPNCKSENPTGICPKCSYLPPIYTIADRDTTTGVLIHDLKYSSARAVAKILAGLADDILPNILGETTIVPLPTISQHIRERGFDHTMQIAKYLAKRRQNWIVRPIIERAHDTVQVGASESARLAQAKKAYKINPKYQIHKSTTYLLFDDVWTTGASMKSAHKILTTAGANKIVMLILAISRIKN